MKFLKKQAFSVQFMKWNWGLRYFDMALVIGGMALAIGVFFIPSIESSPDMQILYKRAKEVREYKAAVKAEEDRRKKEEEELGLVWIPPLTDAPPPSGRPAPNTNPQAAKPQ
jgi:hypothetical protein